MEKQKWNMIIIAVVGFIISVGVLLVIYDYNPCDLFEDLLMTICTGFVIAIPSGCFIIKGELKRVRNEQAELLSDLDTMFKSISFSDYDNYNPSDTERARTFIVKLYYSLGKEITDNYLRKKEQIEKLLDEIHCFSISIINLNKNYKKITKEQFCKDVENICAKRDLCCELIKGIQEG